MAVNDLKGEALTLYESWRAAGYSPAAARAEVENSGVLVEQQLAEMYQARGLSPEASQTAARGGAIWAVTAHPFDQLVEAFKAHGQTPEAARLAAIGRGRTESQARQAFEEVTAPSKPAATKPISERRHAPAEVPPIVARSDELIRQGLTEAAARRQAFAEQYGRPPRRQAKAAN